MRISDSIGRTIHVLVALLVAGAFLYLTAEGAGSLPPLGPTFNPSTGVWTAAADAQLPQTATLHLSGLNGSTTVVFESNGTAHITAHTDHDLFWTIGYLHARFRLFQMDLLRRQGEGRLSEIVGQAALSSDTFELQLGLLRTAQAEWHSLSPHSEAGQALLAYTAGVNARISEDEQTHNLPLMFKILGYTPQQWTPVDSLVIKGDMTQTLDFTDSPLLYDLLVKSLGYARTMQWFPVFPANAQHPYDTGPYSEQPPAPLPAQVSAGLVNRSTETNVLHELASVPSTALHHGSNSNNWAVAGTKTASGGAMLAGDPHLHQTLPAIWYQLDATGPDIQFSGVTIPGVPVILIGHNAHIAWSLTNVQNQATLFYIEKTDSAHPNKYYWRGAWRPFKVVSYDIPVKGAATNHLDVKISVHGPVIAWDSLPGKTISVDWVGTRLSPDIDAMLGVIHASNFTQFRSALRLWGAPSQNFVYADDRGNVGLISAGFYSLIQKGSPWLPLPGTGESDVVGTIPYDDIPQVYNPPSGYVFSANQRPVGATYPYYIGTSLDFFANGYRADEISTFLQSHTHMTVADTEQLQNSTKDYLATLIVPRLLAALRGQSLTTQETQARNLLTSWNDDMDVSSAAATVWWTFLSNYLTRTFQPWWTADHVPASTYSELAIAPWQDPLLEDLEAWTLHDPTNSAFSGPHGPPRTATDMMRQAFDDAVASLIHQLGGQPEKWHWGRVHTRILQSLAEVDSLSYGPRAAGGDNWTVNAAEGDPVVTNGPSWRFIMDWGRSAGAESGQATALGVYPGGQSENPVSAWYENGVNTWWNGQYDPMLNSAAAQQQAGSTTWTLVAARQIQCRKAFSLCQLRKLFAG